MAMDSLRITLAQLNPIVGDLEGNTERLRKIYLEYKDQTDLIVTTELYLTGYPPEDLVMRPKFRSAAMEALDALAALTAGSGPAILTGGLWEENEKSYNAAILLEDGEVREVRYKHHLPNYSVFDELRIFAAGPLPTPIDYRGLSLGVLVCEDLWQDDAPWYLHGKGAELFLALNGSPFDEGKRALRLATAQRAVMRTGLPLIYVNQIGGQDELVFDGGSFMMDRSGRVVRQLDCWQPQITTLHLTRTEEGWELPVGQQDAATEESSDSPARKDEIIYHALVTGLKDYVEKNGFPGVVLGLSGGIDSALAAAVAVDALGAQKVHAVMMPSPYTSRESLDAAEDCARALGIRYDVIPIAPGMEAFEEMLAPVFAGKEPDVTEENIQSRLRGVILMALSNKQGSMVLSTGNKSEMSVGYTTLYGDLCGGFSVLKDVYKTRVYSLSHWRNHHTSPLFAGPDGTVIPEIILTRPPSAELRPDQKDADSLPPYDILDPILHGLIEEQRAVAEMLALGYEESVVKKVRRLLYLAEYKRRQAPPGVKITPMAFGRDRRYPITNRFTWYGGAA